MRFRECAIVLTALLLAIPGMLPAPAQQRQERKVFTNEDVRRTSPTPPKTEPAPTPEPASQPAPPGEPAPEAQTAPAKQAGGLQAQLKQALEYQAVFRNAMEEYSDKMEQETDEALQLRWLEMSTCLSNLLRENQLVIDDLNRQLGEPAGQE